MEHTKFIITINRECGSGGGEIARKLGDILDIPVYSKLALKSIEKKYNLTEVELEQIKASKRSWWDEFCHFYRQFGSMVDTADRIEQEEEITSQKVYNAESAILKEAAQEESCIMVGRSSFHIFRNEPHVMKVLIIANKEARVERIMQKQQLTKGQAEAVVDKIDKTREIHRSCSPILSSYHPEKVSFRINTHIHEIWSDWNRSHWRLLRIQVDTDGQGSAFPFP